MAAKTYMELVNRALLESKVTLDPLTTGNFAAPPGSIMYDHFKEWVNTAYEELSLRRPDWFFRKERATVTVYPRIHLSGVISPLAPGNVLVGASSGVQFTVVAVHNFEHVAEPTSTTEYTVSVTYADPPSSNGLILNESINRVSPGPLNGIAVVKGWGYYDFRDLDATIQEITQDSVYINKTVADAAADGDTQSYPVVLLPWKDFDVKYPYRWIDDYYGRAQAIAQTPQGTFELYPRLDKPYLLSFDYTRVFAPMVNFNDTPAAIPDQYHLYIMWKAVLEYADFDGNSKVFARATKHLNEYTYWLERDQLPRPTVIPTHFRVFNGY